MQEGQIRKQASKCGGSGSRVNDNSENFWRHASILYAFKNRNHKKRGIKSITESKMKVSLLHWSTDVVTETPTIGESR